MAEQESRSASDVRTEDMHWGLLLRTDLQDMRQEFRDLRHETQKEIRDLRQETQKGLRDLRQDMQLAVQGVSDEVKDHKIETRSLFYWTIGIMLTLFTMQGGLMVGLLKL